MSDLSELFDRNPLSLSDSDLDRIIARMREQQAQFELGLKAPATKAAPKEPKSTKTQDLLKSLGF